MVVLVVEDKEAPEHEGCWLLLQFDEAFISGHHRHYFHYTVRHNFIDRLQTEAAHARSYLLHLLNVLISFP